MKILTGITASGIDRVFIRILDHLDQDQDRFCGSQEDIISQKINYPRLPVHVQIQELIHTWEHDGMSKSIPPLERKGPS